MSESDLHLRKLLIDIDNKLSTADRAKLSFLLVGIVPQRDLDTITHDRRSSMDCIWEALINQQLISANNVDYLINLLEKIQRLDIVRKLKTYSAKTEPSNPAPDLFKRINPQV